MRKILIYSALITATVTNISGQNAKCGTMNNFQFQSENDKNFLKAINSAEKKAQSFATKNKSANQNIIYIPVVFHCIYKSVNDATYLHDSIFDRQIQILNETYSLSNNNFSNTRPIFDSIATDTEIRFCLAGQDTLGNPTSGIVRHQSSQNWLTSVTNDAIKTAYPPWNPNKYLNVWTCDMSLFGIPIVLGYAAFPGGPLAKDGVVLQSQFVGYQNNGTENNLGRTMVHEVGHWLGLRHIWGDGQNSSNPCDSTDYVDDTPHAADASQTDCDTTKNTCNFENPYWAQLGIDPPDMVENYMDYSKDGCMTMFTKGQKNRMWSFLNTYRSGLLNNPVSCNMVGLNENHSEPSGITIFPNPSNNYIYLNFENKIAKVETVTIIDLSGRAVLFFKSLNPKDPIDISGLIPGIYSIKITSGPDNYIKMVIKQ
ncbi:MAG: M43 family zinc metalloprotease [Bacteroidota bacterium]|jgi:hypothetical protein